MGFSKLLKFTKPFFIHKASSAFHPANQDIHRKKAGVGYDFLIFECLPICVIFRFYILEFEMG
jgi:hypothetical protein